jgi:aminopeptidase
MKSKYLQQYAKLIAKIGVNVQKDQEVLLVSNVEAVKLARLVVNECYALGAKKVRIQ